jgi:hypothetical protein
MFKKKDSENETKYNGRIGRRKKGRKEESITAQLSL